MNQWGIMWPTDGADGSQRSRRPCRTRWLRLEWPGLSSKVPGTWCHRKSFYDEKLYRVTFLITTSILLLISGRLFVANVPFACGRWLIRNIVFRPNSSAHDYMFECQITCGGRSRWCQAWMRLSMMPSPNNPASTVSVTTKETLPAGQKTNHISKNIEKYISKGAMGIIGLTFYSWQIFPYSSQGWLPI